MITAKLGIGPLSPEIVEAVYRFSEQYQIQLMLIASLNQINATGGYVCGWNTPAFKQFCTSVNYAYPQANVLICRDHCGPFFCGDMGMDEVYANLKTDCEVGFDLIHIDMCHLRCGVVEATVRAMEFCLGVNPAMQFEVGTDAIGGTTNPQELECVVKELSSFPIEFFVVNTGSLVHEFQQCGIFDAANTVVCTQILHQHGIKAKEHNSDYLANAEIQRRMVAGVDAMNVAPQFGKNQTNAILSAAIAGGQDLKAWAEEVYSAGNWRKWTNRVNDKLHCIQCGGHYHFSGDNYERLRDNLDLSYEDLVSLSMELIRRYEYSS